MSFYLVQVLVDTPDEIVIYREKIFPKRSGRKNFKFIKSLDEFTGTKLALKMVCTIYGGICSLAPKCKEILNLILNEVYSPKIWTLIYTQFFFWSLYCT